MAEELYALTKQDVEVLRRMLSLENDILRLLNPNNPTVRANRERPNLVGILLDDLFSGGSVEMAILEYEVTNEIQRVILRGEVTGGTFTLTFSGKETGAIPFNATQAEFRNALEALDNINPGDVSVSAFNGQWIIEFTGQYAATDVALVTLNITNLSGESKGSTVNVGKWVDSGRTVTVHGVIPVGDPTPLIKGATAVAIPFPRIGYGLIAVECRNFGPLAVNGGGIY